MYELAAVYIWKSYWYFFIICIIDNVYIDIVKNSIALISFALLSVLYDFSIFINPSNRNIPENVWIDNSNFSNVTSLYKNIIIKKQSMQEDEEIKQGLLKKGYIAENVKEAFNEVERD